MIHFTCDCCQRPLDPQDDLRFVVRMEVFAAVDNADEDEDRDHLEEVESLLERLEEAGEAQLGEEVYQQLRFDLCPECRKKFLRDPLGRMVSPQFDFSKN